ncbi:PREDICTED: universal stress protein A-like protein isoform X2 [Tarenaya hassleriana]|uniref:universal stress protein A-like protein isoform X2 n=1 Tax=Tarenaya hassleriana TaxID=28532 RepID=UPI00053C0AC8|nr:PREDICTED: universal stress protein A-like protein isoform X2 [Tarenaya hassleriana]
MEEQPLETAAEKQPEVHRRPLATKVMVAIDESDNSFYALQWVIDHFSSLVVPQPPPEAEEESPAAATDGGMLTVVHVQQPFQQFAFPAGPGGATAVYMTSSMMEAVRKAQRETATALFARALQICRKNKVNVETLLMEGDPKDVICQAVEEMRVQLLVMGSRGLGKIKRAFLGSVSDYCAHHAKCAILIVKPPRDMAK